MALTPAISAAFDVIGASVGDGALVMPPVTLSASGALSIQASGDLTIGLPVLSGTATLTIAGTLAGVLPGPTVLAYESEPEIPDMGASLLGGWSAVELYGGPGGVAVVGSRAGVSLRGGAR